MFVHSLTPSTHKSSSAGSHTRISLWTCGLCRGRCYQGHGLLWVLWVATTTMSTALSATVHLKIHGAPCWLLYNTLAWVSSKENLSQSAGKRNQTVRSPMRCSSLTKGISVGSSRFHVCPRLASCSKPSLGPGCGWSYVTLGALTQHARKWSKTPPSGSPRNHSHSAPRYSSKTGGTSWEEVPIQRSIQTGWCIPTSTYISRRPSLLTNHPLVGMNFIRRAKHIRDFSNYTLNTVTV